MATAAKRQKTFALPSAEAPATCDNWIGGGFVAPITGKYMDVTSPHDSKTVATVAMSGADDVAAAVAAAKAAFPNWGLNFTVKKRADVLFKFRHLMQLHQEEFAQLVTLEHGKNIHDARCSTAKGNETVEYATSLPQLVTGQILEVSRGVTCQESREPVGVVASIVPFNFPIMVPMWTLPIAIGCGNCIVLKPSEKCPMSVTLKMTELLKEAGLPDGVVNVVNGGADTVNALCDHPDIAALSFVGSSKIAKHVTDRCHASSNGKRVVALGGAKNHMVASPDCNVDMTSTDVMNSYAGSTGQRCMAASMLLTVGPQPDLLKLVVEKSMALKPGRAKGEIGPVIDKASFDRIMGFIERAEAGGATLLLDGRHWATEQKEGCWIGPTIILHKSADEEACHHEIFGPVLSIVEVPDNETAIKIENANEYGNAACIYTSSGATAQWYTDRFSAAMLGVNIGVPVPREPFSFGGMNASKFGNSGDITGEGAIEFFTRRRKITTKWSAPAVRTWLN